MFECLMKEGFKERVVKELIVICVVIEMYEVIVSNIFFDEKRYIENLNCLFELFE